MFIPGKIMALLALALAFAGVSSLSVRSVEAPEITHDGLHLDPDSKVALLYLKPDADFSVYNQSMMLDGYVAFKKNWQRHTQVAGRRVPNREVERIKGEAAELLFESFHKELDEVGGYTFVEQPGDNVMILPGPDRPGSYGLGYRLSGARYSICDLGRKSHLVYRVV